MKLPITLIVLTYNEEENLEQCLESAKPWVQNIFIVDSPSTDKTVEIAKRYTTKIYEHPFKNQADQFNWALDNLPIETEWVLKLDADEYVTRELWHEISHILPVAPKDVAGFSMKRRFYFLGGWIRHGGHYPIWLMRLWRKGKGRSEEREMDEHMVLTAGKVMRLENDFVHDDRKDLRWWIEKHNSYSSREARERMKDLKSGFKGNLFGSQSERKRWLKETVYSRMPLFIRAFLFFIYRYIFRLGFLDGVRGLIFHFLQGFWHQFLIDAKIYEARISRNKL